MERAPVVWQVSGGPAQRPYAKDFLRYGVALIGPGDPGRWTPERHDDEFGAGGDMVRAFARDVCEGDIFLLRISQTSVGAIGIVASEPYLHIEAFDDVNGWDLQHARRVRWHGFLDTPIDFGRKAFGVGKRFTRVNDQEIVKWAHSMLSSPPVYWQSQPLPPLPPEAPPLREVPADVAAVVAEVQDLRALYKDFDHRPMEDELLAHAVIPLLRALGWKPEHIAVKWRWIDVSVFYDLPRTPESCALVIEAKRLGDALEVDPVEQAKGYVEKLGAPRDVLVTDGVRYRLYEAGAEFVPVAYANLARLKEPATKLFDALRWPRRR